LLPLTPPTGDSGKGADMRIRAAILDRIAGTLGDINEAFDRLADGEAVRQVIVFRV
jgi:Zn-dependent alcohol dehydrogenase